MGFFHLFLLYFLLFYLFSLLFLFYFNSFLGFDLISFSKTISYENEIKANKNSLSKKVINIKVKSIEYNLN